MAELWLSISFIFKVKPMINFSDLLNIKIDKQKGYRLILLHCFFSSMPFVEERITGIAALEELITELASHLITENNKLGPKRNNFLERKA